MQAENQKNPMSQIRSKEIQFWTIIAQILIILTHNSRITFIPDMLVLPKHGWYWTLNATLINTGSTVPAISAQYEEYCVVMNECAWAFWKLLVYIMLYIKLMLWGIQICTSKYKIMTKNGYFFSFIDTFNFYGKKHTM